MRGFARGNEQGGRNGQVDFFPPGKDLDGGRN